MMGRYVGRMGRGMGRGMTSRIAANLRRKADRSQQPIRPAPPVRTPSYKTGWGVRSFE